MTRERIALIVGAATVIATLGVLALLDHEGQSEAREQCMDSETRERIRVLSLEGYDRAFRDHTANLFKLWVQDPHDQPKRASVGTQQGISAYVRARALAMNWNPPPCNRGD